MTLANTVESAEDVRKSGNDLYKAGKLLEAVACYKHATELVPSEAAPLSNLSAAYFEPGQYKACRETCHAALRLLDNVNDLERATNCRLVKSVQETLWRFSCSESDFHSPSEQGRKFATACFLPKSYVIGLLVALNLSYDTVSDRRLL